MRSTVSSIARVALSAYATDSPDERQLVAWSSLRSPSLVLMLGEVERRARFGYALQEALKRRGLSERQLAQRMGIDARKVAAWRQGRSLPDLYQTQELVEILRVREALFRDPPEVPKPPPYPIDQYLLSAGESEEQAAARAGVAEVAPQLPGDESGDDQPADDRDVARLRRKRGR